MKKALIAISSVLIGCCSFEAPSKAMSLYEAKQEACAAARDYVRYGTYSQAVYELESYSAYLGRETGNANNKYAINDYASTCLY